MTGRKLKSLPKLKVVRDDYCSQEMTDKIIEHMEKHYPDAFLKLLDQEIRVRIASYYTALDYFVELITEDVSKIMEVPTNEIGIVDLVHEISRRTRKAYNLPEVLPQGTPASGLLNGEPPEFPAQEISSSTRSMGFSQSQVDKTLLESYKNEPDLWFVLSESVRINMRINRINIAIDNNLRTIFEKYYKDGQVRSGLIKLRIEAASRCKKLCGFPEDGTEKLCEPNKYS